MRVVIDKGASQQALDRLSLPDHGFPNALTRADSERRIRAAGFRRDKSLRGFDFTANPNVDPATIHPSPLVNGSTKAHRCV